MTAPGPTGDRERDDESAVRKILKATERLLRQRDLRVVLAGSAVLGLAVSFVLPFLSLFGTQAVGMSLAGFGAFMALSLVLWTRTPFGWGFGAVVAALSLLIAIGARPAHAQAVLVFLGVQLALSVYTGGGYLFTQYVTIQNGQYTPSDTQQMSQALFLPYWFWGIACAAFSALVLLGGLWLYVRPRRTQPSARSSGARLAA